MVFQFSIQNGPGPTHPLPIFFFDVYKKNFDTSTHNEETYFFSVLFIFIKSPPTIIIIIIIIQQFDWRRERSPVANIYPTFTKFFWTFSDGLSCLSSKIS